MLGKAFGIVMDSGTFCNDEALDGSLQIKNSVNIL